MWRNDAESHARLEQPREACGLVISDGGALTYRPCVNVAKDTEEHFAISAREYAEAEESGEVVAVFHSHPNASSAPSEADLAACKASTLPWHILSVPSGIWNGCAPTVADLIGREFAHGSTDCYGLVRDYYIANCNVYLPDFPRDDDWWSNGLDLYRDFYSVAGFDLVQGEIQTGDVIIMQVHASVPNHAAVYLGDDEILHHLHGRLSRRETYGGAWRRMTWGIARHRGR